jgi:hypothetical protein
VTLKADAVDEFDIDVAAVNPDQFEQDIASGGIIPAGYYHAKLNGATRTTSKGDPLANPPKPERAGWKLTFKIVGGPSDGREVEDTLWAPGDSSAMANRVLLFKHRLGLIQRSADGKKFEPVAGKVDFRDCIDSPCIIHVKHEEYERKKDKEKGIAVRLDFNGVYLPDDEKAKAKVGVKVEATATATPSSATPAPAGSAAKKFDTSTL